MIAWIAAGIVVMVSNKEIREHALKYKLLKYEISFSLTTKQLMEKQCRFNEIINPVPASYVVLTLFKVVV